MGAVRANRGPYASVGRCRERPDERKYMAKHYLYRMDHDTGFAPHVSPKICTPCGCKTTTAEAWAEPGSWVIGIGGNGTGKPNALIYALRVHANPTLAEFRHASPRHAAYLRGAGAAASAGVSETHGRAAN